MVRMILPVLFVVSTTFLSTSSLVGAVVEWAVDHDGDWHEASNWSSNPGLPGPEDNVIIDRPGVDIAVTHSHDNVTTVKSLMCNESLLVSSWTLRVLGPSEINGPLTFNSSSAYMVAEGPSASLLATGETHIDGAHVWASGGASIALPQVKALNSFCDWQATGYADGYGSLLDLSHLASIDDGGIGVLASYGGRLDLSGLTNVRGDIFGVTCAGGTVDLSSLNSLDQVKEGRIQVFGVKQQDRLHRGTVLWGQVTHLNRIALYIGDEGVIDTSRLQTFTNAILDVSGDPVTFPAVTNVDGAHLIAEGGSTLSLPLVRTYHGWHDLVLPSFRAQDGRIDVGQLSLTSGSEEAIRLEGNLNLTANPSPTGLNVLERRLAISQPSQLLVVGNVTMDEGSQFTAGVGSSAVLVATGSAQIMGQLDLRGGALAKSMGEYGPAQVDLLTATEGIQGTFDVSTTPGEYLGHGVVYQDILYDVQSVKVAVIQAAPGDTWSESSEGGRAEPDFTVDVADIQQILREAKFNSGKPAVWTDGDFNDDGLVTAADIQLVLSANLFKKGPYAGAEAAEAMATPNVELKLTTEGLVIDTQGAVINGYILSSAEGLLTGDAVENLGVFQVDSDTEISGQMLFALSSEHLLGQVTGAGLTAEQLAGDLKLSYTVAGQAGVYEATLAVPEPATLGLLLSGLLLSAMVCLFRRFGKSVNPVT